MINTELTQFLYFKREITVIIQNAVPEIVVTLVNSKNNSFILENNQAKWWSCQRLVVVTFLYTETKKKFLFVCYLKVTNQTDNQVLNNSLVKLTGCKILE